MRRSAATRRLCCAAPLPPPPFSGHDPRENACLGQLVSCSSSRSLARVHAWLAVRDLAHNLLWQTKLASTYASVGDMDGARLVFDGMQSPDLYSWKVMFRWFMERRQYRQVIEFYRRMRMSAGERDDVVVSVVLKACAELQYLGEGEKLHCDVVKFGNPDDFVLNGLVDMYAKCGEIGWSRKVFDIISERSVVSWTSMISGYVQTGCAEEGFVLFNRMRSVGTQPNEFTLGSLLAGCSKQGALCQGRWIHGYMIKRCMTLNSFLMTGLLDMYAKCGLLRDARVIFDGLHDADLVSWTAMIVGYSQGGYLMEALKLFRDTIRTSIVPNSFIVASLLSVSGQLSDVGLGKVVHGLAIKLGLEEESEARNALLSMYTKCHMQQDARCIFERSLDKDVVAWNSMLTGLSQNGFGYEALSMFHRMRLEGPVPDAVTFVSSITACACLGALGLGSAFHAYAIKYGFLFNVYVGTALVNLYSKCGDAHLARSIFDAIINKNSVTWCAMIGGYGMQGDSSHSLSLFEEMLDGSIKPNNVAFTSILSVCSHTGMVDEGQKYFDSMHREYKIPPSVKHCSSMVDLLARAGRLEEALELIQDMPLEADVSVFGAFLHGCRLHSRMELGEVAVRRMIELNPQNASYYLSISNLYASEGRFDDAARIRKLMKERGLNKSPGCSFLQSPKV